MKPRRPSLSRTQFALVGAGLGLIVLSVVVALALSSGLSGDGEDGPENLVVPLTARASPSPGRSPSPLSSGAFTEESAATDVPATSPPSRAPASAVRPAAAAPTAVPAPPIGAAPATAPPPPQPTSVPPAPTPAPTPVPPPFGAEVAKSKALDWLVSKGAVWSSATTLDLPGDKFFVIDWRVGTNGCAMQWLGDRWRVDCPASLLWVCPSNCATAVHIWVFGSGVVDWTDDMPMPLD